MTWNGRQLSTLTKNGSTFSYKYDVDGLRLEKTANGVTTEYQYVNGQLLGEKRSNGVILRYTYDPFGALSSIRYTNGGGTWHNYIVRCTLSGDVDQIFNTSGNLVARYIYDTWGNTVSVTDASGNAITSTTHIANINPIRYRGYYWDKESELYYLQSRYYDTITKRFVNPDSYVYTGQDMQSANMYAYCGNCPITKADVSGSKWMDIDGGVGGGGGVLVSIGTKEVIKHISKALSVAAEYVASAVAGATARYVYSQQTAEEQKSTSSTLVDVTIAEKTDTSPEPLYFGAAITGTNSSAKMWHITTSAMTYSEARQWVDLTADTHIYGKNASWGLYTMNSSDAKKMALDCFDTSIGNKGDVRMEHHNPGEYEHFHPPGHVYKNYQHIHFWYGQPY